MDSERLSIAGNLAGKGVFLTGGLGFLGSCLLEQLLRKTQVETVYLLVRDKRGKTAQQRVQQLLSCPLFKLLHKQAAADGSDVFDRVKAVAGDLVAPGLGLSASDAAMLQGRVHCVIHSAANLTLDADIQETLRDNYFTTRALMDFASKIEHLQAFVHTSTYYVNNYMPRNSLVMEKIYPMPLQLDGKSVGYGEFVPAVMTMQPEDAEKATQRIMQDLQFTSTYAFGKNLTEQLVNDTFIKPGVAKAIVRPSLISAIAGAPYPGWISGFAGSPGYCMAYAFGYLQGSSNVAWAGDYICDLIPCDTVAMLIIAATAEAIQRNTKGSQTVKATIYHACSSESNTYTLPEALRDLDNFWTLNPPSLKLPATGYVQISPDHKPIAKAVQQAKKHAALKLHLFCSLLKFTDRAKVATSLQKSFEAFTVQNTTAYDRSVICSVDNGRALLSAMSTEERQEWQVVWDSSQMSGSEYMYLFQTGIRQLLMRLKGDVVLPGKTLDLGGGLQGVRLLPMKYFAVPDALTIASAAVLVSVVCLLW